MTDSEDELNFLKVKRHDKVEDSEQEIGDLLAKKRFVVLLGIFFFLFFVSTFLWVVLFGLLNSNNLELGNYVVNIPTLGDYYDSYEKFYHIYDGNRDVLIGLTKELDINSNMKYKVSISEISEVTY